MTNKDKDIIEHILMRCNRVNNDVIRFGNSYADFISDESFHDSVSMNLLQIGELSNKLSSEFKDSTRQHIPWKQIYDMRNHFAHGYDVMDDRTIWDVVANDIPILKSFCESVLNEIENPLIPENRSQNKNPSQVDKTTKATLGERLAKVRSDKESQPSQTQSHEQTTTKKNDVLE